MGDAEEESSFVEEDENGEEEHEEEEHADMKRLLDKRQEQQLEIKGKGQGGARKRCGGGRIWRHVNGRWTCTTRKSRPVISSGEDVSVQKHDEQDAEEESSFVEEDEIDEDEHEEQEPEEEHADMRRLLDKRQEQQLEIKGKRDSSWR